MPLTEPLRISFAPDPRHAGDPRVRLDFNVAQLEDAYGITDEDSAHSPVRFLESIQLALKAAGFTVEQGRFDVAVDSVYLYLHLESLEGWDSRDRDLSLAAIQQLSEFAAGAEFVTAETGGA